MRFWEFIIFSGIWPTRSHASSIKWLGNFKQSNLRYFLWNISVEKEFRLSSPLETPPRPFDKSQIDVFNISSHLKCRLKDNLLGFSNRQVKWRFTFLIGGFF